MSGLGFVLGGALSGYGAGQAASIQAEDTQRRQIALENLRSQNQEQETARQYDLMDRNASRQTDRETDKTLIVNKQQGDIVASRDKTQHGYDVQILGIKGDQDKELTRIKADLDQRNDAASKQLSTQIESGQIKQIIAGQDGYYAVKGDGTTVSLGVKPQPKSSADTTLAGLGITGAATPTSAPAPTPTPAPAVARPAGDSKTYTMGDASATAQKYGITLDEVQRRMRAAGYKLTGG